MTSKSPRNKTIMYIVLYTLCIGLCCLDLKGAWKIIIIFLALDTYYIWRLVTKKDDKEEYHLVKPYKGKTKSEYDKYMESLENDFFNDDEL